jgi:CSLREA domain-containing protein
MIKTLLFIFVLFIGGANASTFAVNKTADTNDGICDSDCSLREAVGAANSVATNDTIIFSIPDSQCPNKICNLPINLSFGHVTATNNGELTIQGKGWMWTVLSGGIGILSNGGNTNFVVNDLRITGAVNGDSGSVGAGFYNDGTATLNRVLLDNNRAGSCHGIYSLGNLTINDSAIYGNFGISHGGGICSGGTTTNIINSSVNGNNSQNGMGGGIFNSGTLNLTNSTVSGNNAGTYGGAVTNTGIVNLNNSTIADNVAGGAGGFWHFNSGGSRIIRSRNSIYFNAQFLARYGSDIDNQWLGTVTSLTNNFVSIGTFSGLINGANGDVVGTIAAPILPILSPIGRYGGNSFSQIPLSSSPLLETGNNCVMTLTCASDNPAAAINTDQRGAIRTGNVDDGAIENDPSYVAVLPSAFLDVPYDLTLVPNTGTFTYSLQSGSVPTGMSFTNAFAGFSSEKMLSPQAVVGLSGTPTVGGTYNFTVRITNGTNTADVNYRLSVSLAPTAANASLSGRALTSSGRGIARVQIAMTNANGETRYASTNPFGYYRFADLQAGETYILLVASKRYQFTEPTRVLTVSENLDGIDFIAN